MSHATYAQCLIYSDSLNMVEGLSRLHSGKCRADRRPNGLGGVGYGRVFGAGEHPQDWPSGLAPLSIDAIKKGHLEVFPVLTVT